MYVPIPCVVKHIISQVSFTVWFHFSWFILTQLRGFLPVFKYSSRIQFKTLQQLYYILYSNIMTMAWRQKYRLASASFAAIVHMLFVCEFLSFIMTAFFPKKSQSHFQWHNIFQLLLCFKNLTTSRPLMKIVRQSVSMFSPWKPVGAIGITLGMMALLTMKSQPIKMKKKSSSWLAI